ncbi:MAG: type IV conjugative transfer system protein TraL [Parachlamydiales bacterium]
MKEGAGFYKYLDNPKMLMGMAISDLLSLAIPLYAGICLKKFILFGILGAALFSLRRKIARALPKYYLTGLVYWYIPGSVFNRLFKVKLPPSHKRFYLR